MQADRQLLETARNLLRALIGRLRQRHDDAIDFTFARAGDEIIEAATDVGAVALDARAIRAVVEKASKTNTKCGVDEVVLGCPGERIEMVVRRDPRWNGVEDPFTNLDKINPDIQIYARRDMAARP